MTKLCMCGSTCLLLLVVLSDVRIEYVPVLQALGKY